MHVNVPFVKALAQFIFYDAINVIYCTLNELTY